MFSENEKEELERQFIRSSHPDEQILTELAYKFGLTKPQIWGWFNNRGVAQEMANFSILSIQYNFVNISTFYAFLFAKISTTYQI